MPIINKMDEFEGQVNVAANLALAQMASDIERLSKMIAPVLTGALYSSVRHYQVEPLHWKISFGEDSTSDKYAIFQEFGIRADGTHEVKHYTKAGTGSHFLEIAGSNVAITAPGTFKGVMAEAGHGLL